MCKRVLHKLKKEITEEFKKAFRRENDNVFRAKEWYLGYIEGLYSDRRLNRGDKKLLEDFIINTNKSFEDLT